MDTALSKGGAHARRGHRRAEGGRVMERLGFSPEADQPVPYIARTRSYYAALGYTVPYRWAAFAEVPFAPLRKPLAQCRVALVTTAARFDPAHGDQGPGEKYNGSS